MNGAPISYDTVTDYLDVFDRLFHRVDIDLENQRLVGKETGRSLSVGDRVRARIVGVDLNEKNVQGMRGRS